MTPAMLQQLAAPNATDIFVILITVEHDLLDDPARFSSVPVERHSDTPLIYKAVSRGNDYIFVPMQITLPAQIERRAPAATIRLSNVGRELIEALRQITSPPKVTMEILLQSDLETVEVVFPTFDLVQENYDQEQITLSLVVDAMVAEGVPAGSFDPASFPGLA